MTYLKADISALCTTTRNTRRANGFCCEYTAIDPATGRAIVIARLYQPGSVMHCSLWINWSDTHGRGQGQAGGGGYHKASAALDAAIRDAGIALRGDVYGSRKSNAPASISGVGEAAMHTAIYAIATAVTGKRRFIVHTAHP